MSHRNVHRTLFIASAFLCTLLLCSTAYAQVVPSLYTPLATCRLFDSRANDGAPLQPGVTTFLTARGACNVPVTANAVAFIVTATGATSAGNVKLWESSLPVPTVPVMVFRGNGNDSSLAIVRLCYPALECGEHDTALQVSFSASHVVIDITGYFEPAPSEQSVSLGDVACASGADCWIALGDSILPLREW